MNSSFITSRPGGLIVNTMLLKSCLKSLHQTLSILTPQLTPILLQDSSGSVFTIYLVPDFSLIAEFNMPSIYSLVFPNNEDLFYTLLSFVNAHKH